MLRNVTVDYNLLLPGPLVGYQILAFPPYRRSFVIRRYVDLPPWPVVADSAVLRYPPPCPVRDNASILICLLQDLRLLHKNSFSSCSLLPKHRTKWLPLPPLPAPRPEWPPWPLPLRPLAAPLPSLPSPAGEDDADSAYSATAPAFSLRVCLRIGPMRVGAVSCHVGGF